MQTARDSLIDILRLAYSGERAAGYAYRGHWHSVRAPAESERIRAIEEEEWHHRRLVRGMLQGLGAQPGRFRERVLAAHPLHRLIRVWTPLPPRGSIRAAFATPVP